MYVMYIYFEYQRKNTSMCQIYGKYYSQLPIVVQVE